MTSPSLNFLLSVPAVLLILGSCIVLLKEKGGRYGSVEMVLGAALMVVSIIGSLSLYYYSFNHQYMYEQDLKANDVIFRYLVKLMPIGLLIFSIGFTRYTKLLGKIFNKARG